MRVDRVDVGDVRGAAGPCEYEWSERVRGTSASRRDVGARIGELEVMLPGAQSDRPEFGVATGVVELVTCGADIGPVDARGQPRAERTAYPDAVVARTDYGDLSADRSGRIGK